MVRANLLKFLARRRKRAARGVTLVEVLIVVAIMAVISGGVTLVAFPLYKESRIKIGVQGCQVVRSAAELYQNLEGSADQCPTIQDLVTSKKLDGKKVDDPWGSTYKVDCTGGEIHGVSAGNDKKFGTQDDLRDDFKDADIKRVKNL
ncbi:MAG: prepilin-type N-terminal cleavage/methylation domain-containing protein [Minicystis sp.]